MSIHEEEVEIICDSNDTFESIQTTPTDTQHSPLQTQGLRTEVFEVVIREFEIKKQSVGTETQIYHLEVLKDGGVVVRVHRRYSDFEFLSGIIQEHYPGLIIPGLEEKSLSSFFNVKMSTWKQEAVIRSRMEFLSRFLTRILNIDLLRGSREIENFLSVDEQFEIYKKSHAEQVKKKGIVENIWCSATGFFKTRKTDSKYEKIMEEALLIYKEVEAASKDLSSHLHSFEREVALAEGLRQTNPELFERSRLNSCFKEEWDYVSRSNPEREKTADQLVYLLLDLKMLMSIIDRRYELKEKGENKTVLVLERVFESRKDEFLIFVRRQLEMINSELGRQIGKFKDKMGEIWLKR